MDLFDGLVLVGVLVLAVVVALVWGWLALLAYLGVVLIVAGMTGAVLRVRS